MKFLFISLIVIISVSNAKAQQGGTTPTTSTPSTIIAPATPTIPVSTPASAPATPTTSTKSSASSTSPGVSTTVVPTADPTITKPPAPKVAAPKATAPKVEPKDLKDEEDSEDVIEPKLHLSSGPFIGIGLGVTNNHPETNKSGNVKSFNMGVTIIKKFAIDFRIMSVSIDKIISETVNSTGPMGSIGYGFNNKTYILAGVNFMNMEGTKLNSGLQLILGYSLSDNLTTEIVHFINSYSPEDVGIHELLYPDGNPSLFLNKKDFTLSSTNLVVKYVF